MARFFPTLVKDILFLDHPPWMKYIYVRSFEELDALLRRECGDDWKTQPWAVYWLRSYWNESKPKKQRTIKRSKRLYRYSVPYYILVQLVHYYAQQQYSLRKIVQTLRTVHSLPIGFRRVKQIFDKYVQSASYSDDEEKTRTSESV